MTTKYVATGESNRIVPNIDSLTPLTLINISKIVIIKNEILEFTDK